MKDTSAKKLFLYLFLLFLFYIPPSYAQESIKIYLPIIWKGEYNVPQLVEKWKVISPVESTNFIMNPSAETTSNYSALGAATVTRSSTYQKYGVYSYRVQTGTNGSGVSLTLSTLPNENCFVTARIRGRIPINLRFIIGNSILTPILIEKIDVNWSLYGTMFPAASCSGRTELRMIQQGNGIGDFYVDGIQVENLEYWTSYIDGDQEGCYWDGSAHASISKRSVLSREGGQVKDLYKDYGFLVEKVIGGGAISRDLIVDEYALLPGGELNEIKIHPREWSLIGKFIADSDDELYQNRQDLVKLLRKNPQKQPTKFLFYHPRGVREIKAFYAGGLEGDMSVFYDSWVTEDDDKWAELNKYIEKAAIQLRSPDPYFYGQGEKAAALDANDTTTFRAVAGRLKNTGQWDDLGPPNAAGTYTAIYAITEDDTYIYFGGDFLNFDNIAAADYIVRYNKQTGAYSALSVGLTGIVYALALASNGDLYIGGAFTNAGGIAAADYVTRWNGSNFNAVGSPVAGAAAITSVRALVFDHSGNLYIGGDFDNWAGIANADSVVMWNGTSYSALSTGTTGNVYALALGPDNTLYVGGSFTSPQARVMSWDGSIFSAMGSGLVGQVETLAVGLDGTVYAGGSFAIGDADAVAFFKGTDWQGMGTGLTSLGIVYSLAVGPDDTVYAGGRFTVAGDISLFDRVARWNGATWTHLDLDLPGTPIVYEVFASKYVDPVVPQKYNLYLGFDTAGTGGFAGKTTVTNEGSVDVFPKFIFKRSGGTTITLETIKNETTGKELLFNYGLLDGEQLTIDLAPTRKSIGSSYWGDRMDAILANSDFGSWMLEVSSNNITVFATDNFTLYPSSLDSFVMWKETYESFD